MANSQKEREGKMEVICSGFMAVFWEKEFYFQGLLRLRGSAVGEHRRGSESNFRVLLSEAPQFSLDYLAMLTGC